MWRTLNCVRKSLCAFSSSQSVTRSAHNGKPGFKNHISVLPIVNEKNRGRCGHGNSNSNGERRSNGRAKHNGPFYQVKDDWMEAFGWSGVVFLSWYLWFPCTRRRISSNPAERYAYQSLPEFTSLEYASIVKSFSNIVLDSSAKYVLPVVSATKSVQPSFSTSEEIKNDELLHKSCANLELAHEKVRSDLSNWLGTESMQEGKHEEAFNHFVNAASSNHPAAFFNLGLCYEMGLGTSRSFKKAAEYYKKASDLGHATAMYNLGVFFVHGWGGLKADSNVAHQLFIAASKLGQKDAKRALEWEEDDSQSCETEDEHHILFQDVIEPKNNDVTDKWLRTLNITLKSVESSPFSIPEKKSSDDSGVNDLSPPNDVQICF